jgi:hypothetical protein
VVSARRTEARLASIALMHFPPEHLETVLLAYAKYLRAAHTDEELRTLIDDAHAEEFFKLAGEARDDEVARQKKTNEKGAGDGST